MRRLRLGIFEPAAAPTDGGSATLRETLGQAISTRLPDQSIEIVPVPWSDWSYRRQPLRYALSRVARALGGEIAPADLRPVCRRRALDLAYFPAPAFARIDVPFVFTLWDACHRTIPEFPEVRCARDTGTQREA